jgi:LacI family transcriptional regulator
MAGLSVSRGVTRNQVAERAGVSTAVVSYVLNDGPRAVAPATRDRVLGAVRELGYRPNHLARSLRSRRTRTLGLLVPDASNPFYSEVAKGIEEEGYRRGYSLTMGNTNGSPERRASYVESLVSRQVDAVLYDSTGVSLEEVELLERYGVLAVYMGTADEVDDGVGERIPSVTIDTRPGGEAVGRHLLARGHRRMACVMGSQAMPPDEQRPWARVEGFLDALGSAGLEAPVVWAGEHPDDGYRAAGELLEGATRPTAIFAANDLLAIGVMRRAFDLGLRVPEDLAVCGFDDIAISSYVQPRLTTVRIPKLAMGRSAARIVLAALERGPDESHPLRIPRRPDLAVELVVRDST